MAETKTKATPLRISDPAAENETLTAAMEAAEAMEIQLAEEAELAPVAAEPTELERQAADLQAIQRYMQMRAQLYRLYRQYAASALAPSDLISFADPNDPAPEFHVTGSGAFKILNMLGVQVVIDRMERIDYPPSKAVIGTVVHEVVEALRSKGVPVDEAALVERLMAGLSTLVQSAHYGYVVEGRFRLKGNEEWIPITVEVSTKLPFFGSNPIFGRDPGRVPEQFMRQYAMTQLHKTILRIHGLQRLSVADLEAAGWPPDRIKRVVMERRARRPGGSEAPQGR